jgi:hypothetical protein
VKIRRKARSDWLALMPNAHEGYVSWEKAETIRKMVSSNVPTSRHHGAPKHGDAWGGLVQRTWLTPTPLRRSLLESAPVLLQRDALQCFIFRHC